MRRFKQLSFGFNCGGLTLAELLIAMVITAVILTAVATLAYAMGAANDATNDSSLKQTHIRYTTLRLNELIRNCKLVCATPGNDLVIWRADDNGNNKINVNELAYIERGSAKNHLWLCTFYSAANPVIQLSAIQAYASNWWLAYNATVTVTQIVPQASNVLYTLDVAPPDTKFVSIMFNVLENGTSRQYQVNAALRCWAGNLLSGGSIVSSDDD